MWSPIESWPADPTAWSTPWIIAQRMVDCLMQSAWMEGGNTKELSGHVHGHLRHMQANRGADQCSHAAVFDAIQIMAAIRFDKWPESRVWRERGINQLEKSLCATGHADGSPKDGTAALRERLWMALLAQAALLKTGHTLSTTTLQSVGLSIQFLVNLSGPSHRIPMFGEAPLDVTRNGFEPTLAAMAHLAHAWLGISGPRPEGPDPLLMQMAIDTPQGNPWPIPRHWTAHKWASDVAVAHNPIHRVICRATDQSIWWALGGQNVLRGSAVNGTRGRHHLRSVRTDGRMFSADLDGLHLRFEGRRLTVSGGPVVERQRWYFPAGTHVRRTTNGFCATNAHGMFEISASQEWSVGEDCIVGPPNRAHHRLRFEHRPS